MLSGCLISAVALYLVARKRKQMSFSNGENDIFK
jgi:hypothetical protein